MYIERMHASFLQEKDKKKAFLRVCDNFRYELVACDQWFIIPCY